MIAILPEDYLILPRVLGDAAGLAPPPLVFVPTVLFPAKEAEN